MTLDVQYPEAAELLWSLFRELPEEKRRLYAKQVDRVASTLHHPPSDADVAATISSDGGDEFTVTPDRVVLPVERSEVP
jgi:hypothetical protein